MVVSKLTYGWDYKLRALSLGFRFNYQHVPRVKLKLRAFFMPVRIVNPLIALCLIWFIALELKIL